MTETRTPPVVSYHYDPQRGVYGVIHRGDAPPAAPVHAPHPDPSTLRALFDCDVALYDCGCWCGMADARRNATDRRAYEALRPVALGLIESNISRAFAEGYRAGFSAIVYGAMR